MRIELTLIRDGGSRITMRDGTTYHFKPTDDDERHIAEVADPAHAERLLSIAGYRAVDGAGVPVPPGPMTQTDADNRAAATAAALAALPVTASAPIVPPTEAPAVPVTPATGNAEWTPPVWRTGTPVHVAAPATDYDALSDAELRALFEQEKGRAPHPKMARDKIIEAVKKARGFIN